MVAETEIAPAPPLSKQPEVRPTPLAALAHPNLPTKLHFVRSHFGVPARRLETWSLEVAGAVEQPGRYSLADLKRKPTRTQTVVLECAGHRRNEFHPSTSGLPWGAGAVSEARWTGIPLAELLAEVSLTAPVCEVVFEGADRGPHRGASEDVPFARSIPFERALAGDVLLAWEMNDEPIPPKHGAPLRAIIPGCYGVASVKWLRRIELLPHPFTGPFQTHDYRLLATTGPDNGAPLEELRVNSLIVKPEANTVVTPGPLELLGIAWSGRYPIATVEVRLAGRRWEPTTVRSPQQPWSLTRWSAQLELPPGNHTIEVRARDYAGAIQPADPEWNALGYANNSIHRIPIAARSTAQPTHTLIATDQA